MINSSLSSARSHWFLRRPQALISNFLLQWLSVTVKLLWLTDSFVRHEVDPRSCWLDTPDLVTATRCSPLFYFLARKPQWRTGGGRGETITRITRSVGVQGGLCHRQQCLHTTTTRDSVLASRAYSAYTPLACDDSSAAHLHSLCRWCVCKRVDVEDVGRDIYFFTFFLLSRS